jgi:hypothetical protein
LIDIDAPQFKGPHPCSGFLSWVLDSGAGTTTIIIVIIVIITETYLPIVKDSSAQGEAKEEEAALTFG